LSAREPAVLATSTFFASPKQTRVSPSEKETASVVRVVISLATSA